MDKYTSELRADELGINCIVTNLLTSTKIPCPVKRDKEIASESFFWKFWKFWKF
jgi:hypothetical protein